MVPRAARKHRRDNSWTSTSGRSVSIRASGVLKGGVRSAFCGRIFHVTRMIKEVCRAARTVELRLQETTRACARCSSTRELCLTLVCVQVHTERCAKRLTTCSACLTEVPYDSLSMHKASCPDGVIPCTHAPYGCPWTGRRAVLQSTHISTCPYESIKGFFTIHDKKMTSLTQENVQLRHQISVLQGMMAIMQRELDSVKRVLGPWYRPEATLASMEVQPDFVESAVEMPAYADGTADSARMGTILTDVTFASFFPPAEDNLSQTTPSTDQGSTQYRASTSTSATVPSPSSTPTNSTYTAPAHHRQRPPPSNTLNLHMAPAALSQSQHHGPSTASASSSSVAPLNISTTLYGTLSSLHTSVVSLGTALDSLGRHQDVTLTTETMRMAEEIRSLRAVVNGLRMQVHAIMVDRNAQVHLGGASTSGSGNGVGARGTTPTGRTDLPGPVSSVNLPQAPPHPLGYAGMAIPGLGEPNGPWPPVPFFGLPLPRFTSSSSSSNSAPSGPVTKL